MRCARVILIILSATFAVACISNDRVVFRDTDPLGWHRGEGVVIIVPNRDTMNLCDINLVFKTDRTFRYDSIPFLVKVVSPSGNSIVERAKLYPGNNPETGITGHSEHILPYRTKALLTQSGDYRIVVDCQLDEVIGVVGVGVQIAETEK